MDIDVSKENIQPLRGGRNLLQLGQALQAQSDVDAQRQLQQQKEAHEAAIRHYQGPDPLDPWFNYIQWIEQSYPKHGHEGHMDRIIKDCLQTFEKDERYYQDRRFVKLWIKYVDCLANPLEIYQRLYNTGIGVECSEFYRAWACYCEESGDFKKANQVYVLGLQGRAQPLDELEDAHKNFQLFFAQRILHDDSPTKRKAASALAETRQALTSLKSFKRRNIANVPVQRIGESVKSTMPGVVRQQTENRLPGSNIMVNVYEDAPSTSQPPIPGQANPGPASLVQACGNVENEKEVGIWTNAKTKMVHSNVVPHQPLAFTPYIDEDDALKLPKNHMPHCVDDLSFTVALCVPDPPDPTKIPHYNKAEVYVNDTEYSLEEIRARKYDLKKKPVKTEQETAPEPMNTSNNVNESIVQYNALETLANCALDTEQDHMAQLRPLAIPAIQNIKVTNIHSPGEPKVLVNLDSKEFSELSSKRNDENQRADKSLNKSNNYDAENLPPTYGKPTMTDNFNDSLVNNVFGDITMNTKEARWELRNMFNGDSEPSLVQPVVQQFDVSKFEIHEDRSMTMAINTKNKIEHAEPKDYIEDKENANKFTVPLAAPTAIVNKTAHYEEPSCTQVFNFNIKDASTPNMSQFKKPISHIDPSRPSVPKFNLDESGMENEVKETRHEQPSNVVDGQGTGLSVIMEATREYNSKSGSSSSGQSTRNNFTGYTTTPYNEKTQGSNYDSMYHQQTDPNHQPSTSKRTSISQPRLPNGKFARAYPQKTEEKSQMPYLHDHQYQKPVNQAYNGYSPQQRPMPNYQQNYSYQQYPNQMINQGYASPTANSYHSPQHAEIQNSQGMSPAAPGFQSPPYNQMGYQSPGHAMLSPQHVYPNRQEYHYPNQNENQHVYANQPAVFQSPPHQTQYQSTQYYQRHSQVQHSQQQVPPSAHQHHQSPHQVPPSPHHQLSLSPHHQVPPSPQTHLHQQTHSQISASPHQSYQGYQMHSQYNNANYSNQHTNQSYAQSPYNQKVESYGQHTQFTVYQSPQAQTYRNTQNNGQENQDVQMKQEQASASVTEKATPKASRKSPSSSLRNIRHEQPNIKSSPDIGFSNQFLNFISNRNEPKDNANTPKFTNSPNISQKMHKNLYVSSPEQAQIPPSSGMSDSDSKDGMTAQTVTPIQSAKITIDKNKDISKRQLDFEHRAELLSEDSRDSGKESRISSIYSRQSDFVSDGYGMDVDSENSMECAAYKSTHSISLVETIEIPRPADIDFPKIIDPFSRKLHSELLKYIKFPNKTHEEGYNEVRSVPKLQVSAVTHVGSNKLSIEKQIGKGNYGAVFLCLDLHSNKSVAVKYQKPSRPWEFYICQEIKARIKDPCMLPGYMDITTAYIADNASLFISEFSRYGSLLDVANKIKIATSKCINEFIVFLLTAEMLSIVHYLHKAQIIHADIKPDNFLLMKIPTEEWRTPSLQLIDLGCAIDMSLFPEGTTFRELIATEGFTCTEMREGKPWTYQTDLYCLAGTIYVILMGSYMKVTNRLGQWNIDKKLPRYMKVSIWDKIFTTLLNVPDCNNLPDLMELKSEVDKLLSTVDQLGSQLRNFANVLKSR